MPAHDHFHITKESAFQQPQRSVNEWRDEARRRDERAQHEHQALRVEAHAERQELRQQIADLRRILEAINAHNTELKHSQGTH